MNGPGEARETDIGLTGGAKGRNHKVYVGGIADHNVDDEKLVDHIVGMVEAKVAAIQAAEAAEAATPDAA